MTESRQNPRRGIVLAVTDPRSLGLMRGQPEHLSAQGWAVTVVVGGETTFRPEGVAVRVVPMRRDPSPRHDLGALMSWVSTLRSVRPAVVLVGTPKAGLLGIVAAWLTRVPHRVYLLRGLRLEGTRGILRRVLWVLEKVSCTLATATIANSPSLREKVVDLRLAPAEQVSVLGSGSSNGVDTTKFSPPTIAQRSAARRVLGVPEDAFVVSYVGRLHADKGLDTLVDALRRIAPAARPFTVVVGRTESERVREELEMLRREGGLILLDHLPDVTDIYRASDVLALPSRREGFPNVVLEAAACGVSAIVSDATGCRDSVVQDETGWIFPVGDAAALADAIQQASENPDEVRRRGVMARARVEREFSRAVVWTHYDEYLRALTRVGTPAGQ